MAAGMVSGHWARALVALALAACSGSGKANPAGSGGAGSADGTGGASAAGGAGASGGVAGAGGGGVATAGQMGRGGAGGAGAVGGWTGGAGSGGAGTGGSGSRSAGLECFRYIEVGCNRLAECRGTEDAFCFDSAAACPQAYFLPGSTRTPESLSACAREWATFDCDRALRGEIPSCATPGTLAPGEHCSYASQCASLVCLADGTCSTRAGANGACSETTTCAPGQSCVGYACVRNQLPAPDTGKGPVGDAGAPCVWAANCRTGLYCEFVTATPGTGRCAVPPSAGSPCGNSQGRGASLPSPSTCDEASYCGKDEMCHALPPVGAACGETGYGGLLLCAPGGYCRQSTLTCETVLGIGESCVQSPVFSGSGKPLMEQCDPGLGASCTCPGVVSCAGKTGTCLVRVKPGDRCASDSATCVYGSICLDGRCDYPPIAP